VKMRKETYDPLQLASQIKPLVGRGNLRRYYRLARPGRWYGGIATADCCGCCLKCVFCWSGLPRDRPEIGELYEPVEVFRHLDSCASKHGYELLRVSGNEPTLCPEHLLELLQLVEDSKYRFILETNGILIDRNYARRLSGFRKLHVRVSLKGTTEQEFSRLTGATPASFNLQLSALRHLLNEGVSCHPAVMLSFSEPGGLEELKTRLAAIDPKLPGQLEEEYVFLYPHVSERLKKAGLVPKISYRPDRIPCELI